MAQIKKRFDELVTFYTSRRFFIRIRAAVDASFDVVVERLSRSFPSTENQDVSFNGLAHNGTGFSDDDDAENIELQQIVVPYNPLAHMLGGVNGANNAYVPVYDRNNNTSFPDIEAQQAP